MKKKIRKGKNREKMSFKISIKLEKNENIIRI